jgi:AraC-like DNA-binding protein
MGAAAVGGATDGGASIDGAAQLETIKSIHVRIEAKHPPPVAERLSCARQSLIARRHGTLAGMERATVEELARAPTGRYVAGETFAHFCASPTLWGVILWGRPELHHALELGRSLVLELKAPAVPHASIVDASRLDGGDASAFAATDGYLRTFGAKLARYVTRLALIRPRGLSGAVVAGAYDVLPRPYPVEVFADARDAFAWLAPDRDRSWPTDGAGFLAALHAEAAGAPPELARLRAFLDAHLADATLAAAVRALALSERTLQRRLGDAGTTFQDQLADARIRAAKRMLAETDAPLTAIAYDVGCASLQHFSALFRKRERESPSAFRKRQRG